jgi:hypothetical protein
VSLMCTVVLLLLLLVVQMIEGAIRSQAYWIL